MTSLEIYYVLYCAMLLQMITANEIYSQVTHVHARAVIKLIVPIGICNWSSFFTHLQSEHNLSWSWSFFSLFLMQSIRVFFPQFIFVVLFFSQNFHNTIFICSWNWMCDFFSQSFIPFNVYLANSQAQSFAKIKMWPFQL